jgi:hypothetical protein
VKTITTFSKRRNPMKRIMMTIAMLFFILMIPLATASFGATIIVPDDQATIQAGIDAAVNGDTVLVRDGTYLLTAAIDFKGKAITVESEHGASSCFLDGQQTTRVVYFHSFEGNNSVLQGFTIRNGHSTQGGGIYLITSSPTISDCTIRDNVVSQPTGMSVQGGGIYSSASSPIISNCTITNNLSSGGADTIYGGGIFITNGGAPIITNTTISSNQVRSSWSALGGGIFVDGPSSPIISDSDISYNSAQDPSWTAQGGGIYFAANTFPRLDNCIINGNSAKEGGGILFNGSVSYPGLTNCTIVRNIATSHGGAIYFYNASTDIINSILWENSPENIYLAGNSNPNITYSDVDPLYPGTGNIDANPAFVDIGTQDFHLTGSSQCINTGNNAAPYLPEFDKDGNDRIINPTVDMGAYEYTGPLDPYKLPLGNGRFIVEVDWLTPTGSSGKGTAISVTSDTGYFWFFENTNVELTLKIHQGCGVNNYWWFFYGALTDVEYTITVTDTETSTVKTYYGIQHIQTSSNDVNAFACP